MVTKPSPIPALTKAKSTVNSAFSDPFNMFMLIPGVVVAVVCFLRIISPWRGISDGIFLLGAVGFIVVYVRAITRRELEISATGIGYREASRRLFFRWSEIEGIRVEPRKKQITIWSRGMSRRLHEFGLPRSELMLVRKALQEGIDANRIPVR